MISWSCLSGFLHSSTVQNYCLEMMLPTVGNLHASINLRQSPTNIPTVQPSVTNPSLRFFSQRILGFIKLAIQFSHHNFWFLMFFSLAIFSSIGATVVWVFPREANICSSTYRTSITKQGNYYFCHGKPMSLIRITYRSMDEELFRMWTAYQKLHHWRKCLSL